MPLYSRTLNRKKTPPARAYFPIHLTGKQHHPPDFARPHLTMPGFSRLRIPRPSDSSEGETGPCYVFDSDPDSDYTSDQLSEVFSSDDEGIQIIPSETQLQSSRRRRPPNPNLVAGLASDLGEKAVRPTRAELPIWQSEGQAPGSPGGG